MNNTKTKEAKVVIKYDKSPEPPVWDCQPALHTWHERYNIGGHHDFDDPAEWLKWHNKIKAIYLPIYMYNHSGTTISTEPFSCPWDSGQIGFVVITRATLQEWGLNWQRITKKRRETIIKWLKASVKLWDDYLTGNTYGFEVVEDGEEIDSCWGFYGREHVLETVKEEYPQAKIVFQD